MRAACLGRVFLLWTMLVAVACQSTASDAAISVTAAVLVENLKKPAAVAVDLNGDCYVVDTGNNRVLKVSILGEQLAAWGVQGSGSGQLRNPGGIVVDDDFNVYVADTDNNRIQKFSADGQPLARWGSAGSAAGQFNQPAGLAVDRRGNLYVADTGNNRVQKFDASGQPLTQWGSTGSGQGQFQGPEGVAVDDQDMVYVSDTGNNRIQKFGADGSPVGWTTGVHLNRPGGIVVDDQRNLYVADSANNRLVKIGSDGQLIGQIGGPGAQAGQLNNPVSLARVQTGVLVVIDKDNGRALVMTPSGTTAASISTVRPRPVAAQPNGTSTPVPGSPTAGLTATPSPARPTSSPTATVSPTPVPADEHWWLDAPSGAVLTEISGTGWQWYGSDDPQVGATASGDDLYGNSEFEIVRTASGQWMVNDDGVRDYTCSAKSGQQQSGDTLERHFTLAHTDNCYAGTQDETWAFARGAGSLDVTRVVHTVDSDAGDDITDETHWHARLLAAGEPTPTPRPSPTPGQG